MHDNTRSVLSRLHRFRYEHLSTGLYQVTTPLTVTAWTVPEEPVPFAEAVRQQFTPFPVGSGAASAWGRPWGTVWFHVQGEIPADWAAESRDTSSEVVIDLGFNFGGPGFQAEATVYAADGSIIKGIEPLNNHVPIGSADRAVDFYLEASANPHMAEHGWFIPTNKGSRATAGTEPLYNLKQVDLVRLNREAWELGQDIWVLAGWLGQLSADSARYANIIAAISDMLDAVDPNDLPGTATAARSKLAPALAAPANASAHHVIATGHAHIDSAWLWPTRETVRKCARTFSNVLALMDDNPDFVFSCSSAQQYAWIQEFYPELFERIREKVATGQFVPVGGMWVESDTNMPGGEALARQLVEGKKFFINEFGVEPMEVWLPDSFGYTAAMPQLVKAAGSKYFLTQKISWNDTNSMPHHTFNWEGIDGTRVFTHFPPVDTYNSELSAVELDRTQRQFREKGRASTSLVPFGWGDGGGGPTREMLAAAKRQANLEGSPRVEIGTPARFFSEAETEYPDPPVWSGELYLEYHRGTYTSQAKTKQGNRRSEHLLREAELWAATASVRTGATYPHADLERIWRVVLLQQFHDILPGSSISWVHEDAERNYDAVQAELEAMIADSLKALGGEGTLQLDVNAGPYALGHAPALGGAAPSGQDDSPADGGAAPSGQDDSTADGVTLTREGTSWLISNSHIAVTVDAQGLICSLIDKDAGRQVLADGETANRLQLFRDIPNEWDAWDIDSHYGNVGSDLTECSAIHIVEESYDRVSLEVTRQVSKSIITQLISVSAGSRSIDMTLSADWHERQKLLKAAFPLDVHAERAASEIQFGHINRPIHSNTSWDNARFETCAHRWIHVGESGYGVAIANDSTYGHDVSRTTREDGGTTTTLRLSLLRAPQFPDPLADEGEHTLSYSLRVGATIADAVREGYRLNLPVRRIEAAQAIEPLLTVDNPAVVVEAVKLAEDGSGDVIVRLYEAHGSRAAATVVAGFDAETVSETDLLERELAEPRGLTGWTQTRACAEVSLRPFQIATLRFHR
ncbi:glycoside hydrolase family 38 C-terminal domain-containing protein [Saxibacter everestensis]|uniref:Glycoside hydrolase family 38 C-terminal domain-containing protein n=1 Tax=Saxibacter everestensis TaxID=2909229 RepID=A0ABY8QUI3_9MICO|nr:glycoside hydrolase family 38 C-terminal domain-containing protein [Brevibacteriaceae bacterium ZFBP1038]